MQTMTHTIEDQGQKTPAKAARNRLNTDCPADETCIPYEWKYLTFADTFDFLASGSNSRSDLDETGDFLYIHYGDIHRHNLCRIDLTGEAIPYILKDKVKGLPPLKDGDLIIADASEDQDGIGKSVEVVNTKGKAAVAGLHTILLRPKHLGHTTITGFHGLIQNIPMVRQKVLRIATGLKVYGISKRQLRTIRIPLPPLHEQKAIAKALRDVDELIEGLDKLIAKKRDIKQATMQQLLTGKRRLPGFSGEWTPNYLGKVGSFAKGSGIKRDQLIQWGIPCIRYGEIYTHHHDYIREFKSFIPQALAGQCYRLRHGDLLFAGSGETAEEIGKCVAFLGTQEAYAGGDIVVLTQHEQCTKFLGYLLNHSSVVVQKRRMAQGDAVVHISGRNLAQIELRLPSVDEQTAIARVLSDMDEEIEALETRRDKTKALKQGMMQELLTGRIRLV